MHLLFFIVFNDLSVWWLIPSLILGFLYAWFFYQKTAIEKVSLKRLLFGFRWLTITFLTLLLLSPLIKSIKERLQKPVIFIVQDASASVALNPGKNFDIQLYHQHLQTLQQQLSEDYDVKPLNFSDAVKSGFNFNEKGKTTDISQVFEKVITQNPNANIGALIIATDGIYNKGANPILQISDVKFPVYSVALGDTVAKKDLVLNPPTYNQLVYLGNNHEVEIAVKAFEAKGTNTVLKVSTNDGQVKQQTLSFSKNEETKMVKFSLETKKKGLQKVSFNLLPITNEVSTQNNTQTIYVEVIDGREQILLLADAPHPDLGALKQAIETNKNYEVKLAFADELPTKIDDYGLIVFHNLPSSNHSIAPFLAKAKEKSKWFIVGSQTDVSGLNNDQKLLNISGSNQDQVYNPVLNSDFYAFRLSDETKSWLQNLAPLTAPFAKYKLQSVGKILLQQQVGNIKTAEPMLVFSDQQVPKEAVLTGEGIWRWRMEDFENNNNSAAFDELINKSVQYLTTKEDKRKFRVSSSKNRYTENEVVLLNAELYNDAYELINEPEVSLELKSAEGKKYSFVFSRTGNAYELRAGLLPPGEYDFIATTKLGTKSYVAKGSFLVEVLNMEVMETKANHQLLYHISKTSGGSMVYEDQMLSLVDSLKKNEKVKTVSYQEKNYEPLINLKWIFVLIILLLSFEWFLRKRNGAL